MIGKSFPLELEYTHAVMSNIPVLALVISEKARWKDSKKEKKTAGIKALEAFKKRLETHSCETWVNLSDLKTKALSLLSREFNMTPRRGWVPSTDAVEPMVANELCRLMRENETLRNLIKSDGADVVKLMKEQIRHTLKVLAINRISLSFYYANGENWENTRTFRYLHLFKLLAPELATPKTTEELSHFLGNILNPDLERVVRKDYPTPSNTVKKIMSDFDLLKLVKCSAKMAADAPAVNDEDWELTELGKETFAAFRLRQMMHPSKNEKTIEENAEEDAEKIIDEEVKKDIVIDIEENKGKNAEKAPGKAAKKSGKKK